MKKAIIPANRNALKGGSYSLILTAVVLAIIVVVNILVSVLPATWTKLDMSSSQLYSITSNTKAVLNNLQKDVKIYWLVQQDQEDSVIENLLAKYEGLSSHVDVVKKNPDVFPTFAEQYTSETVVNNSLIVECGEKYRFVSADDFYPYEVDYTTYEYVYSFDGERQITSAIDYVVSEDLPLVYLLEGHGENALPSGFADQMEKDNIETAQLSLLTMEAVPDDADCIMVYSPVSDISETEKEMLSAYVTAGGKLMVPTTICVMQRCLPLTLPRSLPWILPWKIPPVIWKPLWSHKRIPKKRSGNTGKQKSPFPLCRQLWRLCGLTALRRKLPRSRRKFVWFCTWKMRMPIPWKLHCTAWTEPIACAL